MDAAGGHGVERGHGHRARRGPPPPRSGVRAGSGRGQGPPVSAGETWGRGRNRPTADRSAGRARRRRWRATGRPDRRWVRPRRTARSVPGAGWICEREPMARASSSACSSTSSRRLVPHIGQGAQHGAERRQPGRSVGREVGAAEERPPVRGQEDAHRPSARAGHGLHRLHIDGVDVGPLLAVDLDGHERRVEASALSGSSNDSWAMTWHQWQAE